MSQIDISSVDEAVRILLDVARRRRRGSPDPDMTDEELVAESEELASHFRKVTELALRKLDRSVTQAEIDALEAEVMRHPAMVRFNREMAAWTEDQVMSEIRVGLEHILKAREVLLKEIESE